MISKEQIRQGLKNIQNFMRFLIKRTKNDTILRVASSLSYTSLIALVPVLAIALAVFSAFPVFADVRQQIQDMFIQNLMPDAGQDLNMYFNDFINATAKLTTIGVVGIALTAVLLLSTIENSFNFIFKVSTPRRWTTKITLYWTVITLGPLLLGTGLSLKGMVAFHKIFASWPEAQIWLGKILPALITCLLLVGVYVFIPNKKVSVLSALVGAVTAMILFMVLRQGFALFMLKNNTYKTLYGAVAAVPLTLVWMYLYWAVVIFGAVVTASLDEYRNLGKQVALPKQKKLQNDVNKKRKHLTSEQK
ncbi:MAG: YihY family inner membrane protein [Alphaproteobacteria bacterium]|nr:YihY family inner membrane protein [Alphaproteobacteria bacterium]